MLKASPYYFLFILFVFPTIVLFQTSCSKEYSFEGADSSATGNTIVPTLVNQNTGCLLCTENSEPMVGQWNFKSGNAVFCGATTDAGFIGNSSNTTFTLFGPSACSIDSGLVMSIFLPVPFKEDRFNVTTERVAFYYYDHHSTQDMFINKSASLFSVTIKSFIYSTRIATGTFEGTVYKPNGETAYIKAGKFKVLLK